jgi:hypothetical protein
MQDMQMLLPLVKYQLYKYLVVVQYNQKFRAQRLIKLQH